MSWLKKLLGSIERPVPSTSADWVQQAGSRDGYLREAAVHALAAAGDGSALPVLLERANDWVPQVRQAACRSIGEFLDDAYIGDWARALGSLVALRRTARADHGSLLQGIDAFLSRPGNLVALKDAQAGLPPAAIRFLFSLELHAASDEEARYRVLRSAVLSGDLVIASDAAAQIDSLQSPERRLSIAAVSCSSRYGAVRMAGLKAALRMQAPSVPSLVQTMARDSSASIRAVALAAMTEGHDHLIDEARRTFAGAHGARKRAIALDTLCAMHAEGAMRLCELSGSDRAVAVRCVGYVRRFAAATGASGASRDALVDAALRDRSPRVRRIAVTQVAKGASAPPPVALLGIHRANAEALGSLVGAAAFLSPWSRLEFLLHVATSSPLDAASMRRLHLALAQWSADMIRCFVRPGLEQASALTGLWNRARDGLPQGTQRQIAAHLQAFGM